ncbi:MAG: xanthine dehydrogenase family protein subunit M [Anaerolineaceae bacterium]|nr:xanthine dehydrogenase family protein subunit M [Anaerolineaceae bacterium]
MKPAPFDYYAPTNVTEALDLLADLGYDVKVLAGGQSLVPAMNFRLAQPPALLDLNNISELSYIRPTPEGGVAIGAMARDSDVEHDPLVIERFPVIQEAMVTIAHPQIRNRGTFGGAIAHADPTGQLPAVTLALGARYHLRRKTGERVIPADEFYLGSFTTAIEPEELLVEIEIPPLPAHTGVCYQQMARQAGAQALVGVTAVVTLDAQGACQDVRLTYLSVSETPAFAPNATSVLIGRVPTPELIQKTAETAANVDFDPAGDIHCSPEYRRHLIEVLTVQALSKAIERVK